MVYISYMVYTQDGLCDIYGIYLYNENLNKLCLLEYIQTSPVNLQISQKLLCGTAD